jgi:hypothetical protein
MLKVEYLVILKQDDKFCNTIESLKKFISVDDDLSITGNVISMGVRKKPVDFEIRITSSTIDAKKERYFQIELKDIKNNGEVPLNNICRKIKKIVNRINPNNVKINTLWDDIGRNYALKSYPLINEVENLMRKFLTQFLLINVGMDWSETAVHDEIQEKMKGKPGKSSNDGNNLYFTDFIHLSDVLFKKYRNITLTELDNIILGSINADSISVDEVRKILPLSNWERYFSSVIDYDEEKLKQQWHQLYNFRNDIAHNRFIDKSTYESVYKLHGTFIDLLNKTISGLDKIEINKEDKEEILQTYTSVDSKRLIKIANEVNVATSTIAEFLQKEGFNIENKPIAKLTGSMQKMVYDEFGKNTMTPDRTGLRRMPQFPYSLSSEKVKK